MTEEGDDDDEEEEEDEENPLVFEHMKQCLSLLCKTGDGLGHAFVRLDISDRLASSQMCCQVC